MGGGGCSESNAVWNRCYITGVMFIALVTFVLFRVLMFRVERTGWGGDVGTVFVVKPTLSAHSIQ